MLWNPFSEPPPGCRRAVLAIGNFDGVHSGHCRLLAALRERARDLGAPAICMSFEPHPLAIVRPDRAPIPLSRPERKVSLLKAAGADDAILCQVSPRFLNLAAEEFFREILVERLQVVGLVEGPNFGFGKDRSGDLQTLKRFCAEASVSLDIVPLAGGEQPISSTAIRRLLADGDAERAMEWTGRPHRLRGAVIAGDGRGRQIGFPTANLGGIDVMIPAEGVYAVCVEVDGRQYSGACHIGPAPTFAQADARVETHLIDFTGDLYGKTIDVDFLTRLRGARRFAGVDALTRQLQVDVSNAKRVGDRYRQAARMAPPLLDTIRQWVDLRMGPALRTTGFELRDAILDGDVVTLQWRLPDALAPADSLELLLRLEERIKRVFPEIAAVVSTTSPPGSGSRSRP